MKHKVLEQLKQSFLTRARRPNPIFLPKSGEDQKKSHHVFRRPIFLLKSGEDQKKGNHVFRRPIFLPKSSGQRTPAYAPKSVKILKDFHRTPETALSNTRCSVEPRLKNTEQEQSLPKKACSEYESLYSFLKIVVSFCSCAILWEVWTTSKFYGYPVDKRFRN